MGNSKTMNNKYILGLLVLCFGVAIGFYFNTVVSSQRLGSCVTDLKLTFINSRLDCDITDDKTKRLDILQEKLKVSISLYEKNKQANRVAVFVRDLDSLRFAGVNDGEVFYMASLLKLPLVIAGYKLAEVEPKILDQEILFNSTPDQYDEMTQKPTDLLQTGKKYPVSELIRKSIVYSDNDASRLLFDFYPSEFLDRILQALGIQFVRGEGLAENPITARTYAGVFRTLYNASYLTREYSNKVLTLLTEAVYRNGALAKLPKNVVVAHKFAEREIVDEKTQKVLYKQLHECGIVYAKEGKEPYIFCIMIEGAPDSDLEKIQQDISLSIYNTMIETDGK